jgi:xylulokinase
MEHSSLVVTYDIGTTGVKTCLFRLAGKLEMLGHAYAGYGLYILENGGAEQDPDEWWQAVCATTREVLARAGVDPKDIAAVSFCSQMQCLVLVDRDGRPVRRAMSYMDGRAGRQFAAGIAHGFKISGLNARKLIASLAITKAVAASVKDPVWKYRWVKENEPENFGRVYKWLDAKDYLIMRFTGAFTMTEGSAYATLLYDTREGKRGFSNTLCRMLGVERAHLPDIIKSSEKAGGVTEQAASELGLSPGTPVYGGGGDAELIGVGIGAVCPGETHIYLGTSGWVSTVTEKQIVDTSSMIAAIVGAEEGRYHYFAEMETAGKCLEWVKDHLALDEIGIYLEKKHVAESLERVYISLYDYLCEVVTRVPAGSNGVIFAPWLHGNRCPFEDANARGMFFNIGIETGKSSLIRAVIEGICYHLRAMLEAEEHKVRTSGTILVAGGGAISPVICQILADVLGRRVATMHDPQNAGAYGAAILTAVGLGRIPSVESAKALLPEYSFFKPITENKAVHDRNFTVFQNLYKDNKKSFSLLNGVTDGSSVPQAAGSRNHPLAAARL